MDDRRGLKLQFLPGWRPLSATVLALGFGLSALSRPSAPSRQSEMLFCLSILITFCFADELSASNYVNKTFGDFLLIVRIFMLDALIPESRKTSKQH